MSPTGGGWDTGKVPLELCPDPSAHNSAHNLSPQPEAGLDAAWAEAEAALPEGWWLRDVVRDGNATMYRWQADAVGPKHWEEMYGDGPTPAAALLALTAVLLARLLRPLGLGPLAGADPEVEGETTDALWTHHHRLPNGLGLWHRHPLPWGHPIPWDAAHPGQDPDG